MVRSKTERLHRRADLHRVVGTIPRGLRCRGRLGIPDPALVVRLSMQVVQAHPQDRTFHRERATATLAPGAVLTVGRESPAIVRATDRR
jgi:hypothetical protein